MNHFLIPGLFPVFQQSTSWYLNDVSTTTTPPTTTGTSRATYVQGAEPPTFGLVLQHHVGDLEQFEGEGHLPVGSDGLQQAGQQGGARHLAVTSRGSEAGDRISEGKSAPFWRNNNNRCFVFWF